MSDKHTPGRLRAGYIDERDRRDRMVIRAEDVDGQPYVAICPAPLAGSHEENARRIVALWNAMLSFSTEEIEAGVDLARLRQERDALLSACEAAADAASEIILLSDKSTNAGAAAYGAASTIKARLLPAIALTKGSGS